MRKYNNIVITGASGGLGRDVTQAFLRAGYKVTALSHRNNIPFKDDRMTNIKVDLTNAAETQKALSLLSSTSQIVIHLAHDMKQGAQDYKSETVQKYNSVMFDNIISALGTKESRYILASSISVFADQISPIARNIDSPVAVNDDYTRSKLNMEDKAQEIGAQVVRLPRIVAKGCHNAVNSIIASALNKKVITLDRDKNGNTLKSSFASSTYVGQLLLQMSYSCNKNGNIVLPNESVFSLQNLAQFVAQRTGSSIEYRVADAKSPLIFTSDNSGLQQPLKPTAFMQRYISRLIA